MRCFVLILIILLVGVMLSGCYSVPYSKRSQFILTSEKQEAALGNDAWKNMMIKDKLSDNPFMRAALVRVGRNLAQAVDKKNFQWEFQIFQNKEPNAFCLPGGKVGVYSGLFKYVKNDAELAAIVGHEISHAVARHGGASISREILLNSGINIGIFVTSFFVPIPFYYGSAVGVLTDLGVTLPYSRVQEYEADYLGLLFMAKAGYDPHAAVAFWEKFSKLSQSGALGEFFSTHPIGSHRIEELKEKLPQALKFYQKAKIKHGLGNIYPQPIPGTNWNKSAQKQLKQKKKEQSVKEKDIPKKTIGKKTQMQYRHHVNKHSLDDKLVF